LEEIAVKNKETEILRTRTRHAEKEKIRGTVRPNFTSGKGGKATVGGRRDPPKKKDD